MRAVIRRSVDVEKPINLRKLSPRDKILVSIRKELSNSAFFVNSKSNKQREANRKRVKKEEDLKAYILTRIHQELVDSYEATRLGKVANEIVIAIEAKYKDVIFDTYGLDGTLLRQSILKSSEFLPYEIIRVEEEPDIRRAFSNMPYLFRVRKVVM